MKPSDGRHAVTPQPDRALTRVSLPCSEPPSCPRAAGALLTGMPADPRLSRAARLKTDHRMSDADAFATATAIANDATLLTGDPELMAADVPWRWEDLRP